jgi:hypothetical protein
MVIFSNGAFTSTSTGFYEADNMIKIKGLYKAKYEYEDGRSE